MHKEKLENVFFFIEQLKEKVQRIEDFIYRTQQSQNTKTVTTQKLVHIHLYQ